MQRKLFRNSPKNGKETEMDTNNEEEDVEKIILIISESILTISSISFCFSRDFSFSSNEIFSLLKIMFSKFPNLIEIVLDNENETLVSLRKLFFTQNSYFNSNCFFFSRSFLIFTIFLQLFHSQCDLFSSLSSPSLFCCLLKIYLNLFDDSLFSGDSFSIFSDFKGFHYFLFKFRKTCSLFLHHCYAKFFVSRVSLELFEDPKLQEDLNKYDSSLFLKIKNNSPK